MAVITLRVLDGADRGKIFEDIEVPVTIGREEGNSIRLNDERISRFHLKIQQDHDDIVLTDLESTNGSRVNNEDVQLKILRHGDLITLGRSTLIFGDRDQINRRMQSLVNPQGNGKGHGENGLRANDHCNGLKEPNADADKPPELADLALPQNWREDPNYQLALLDIDPPQLPDRLSPGQAAKLSETFDYFHMLLRRVVSDANVDHRQHRVELSLEQWQKLLDLQSRIAEYLRHIDQP